MGISYLGFYIDPSMTPARVALGMLCLVVVMTSRASLLATLPPTGTTPWLVRCTEGALYFNLLAMAEQIAVSFGLQSRKWLEAQKVSAPRTLTHSSSPALATAFECIRALFCLWQP